ncbi:MAG: hypothetical protein MUC80_03955 [Candidatus Thermoplasmatota archaeon]|jgi:hypothetical protein|nr:hypothetical protein [Candidatus Thermoplasmatota archaeon]
MKKNKVVFGVLFLLLLVLPVVSVSGYNVDQKPSEESATPVELKGYLLIHVSVYTPGEGLHPYMGANISVKGFFHKYTGQTDERGDCLFQLHSRLFRPKLYFIKVSIPPADLLHTKINSMYMQTGQIVYRDYLFVIL